MKTIIDTEYMMMLNMVTTGLKLIQISSIMVIINTEQIIQEISFLARKM